jgi:hypothetical protein
LYISACYFSVLGIIISKARSTLRVHRSLALALTWESRWDEITITSEQNKNARRRVTLQCVGAERQSWARLFINNEAIKITLGHWANGDCGPSILASMRYIEITDSMWRASVSRERERCIQQTPRAAGAFSAAAAALSLLDLASAARTAASLPFSPRNAIQIPNSHLSANVFVPFSDSRYRCVCVCVWWWIQFCVGSANYRLLEVWKICILAVCSAMESCCADDQSGNKFAANWQLVRNYYNPYILEPDWALIFSSNVCDISLSRSLHWLKKFTSR